MPTEMTSTSHEDQQAVTAVRDGDAERYRELVERHERRVYAIAWSRLGDAALAEEATQEAFIRGYQRLWLLGDGAKFSGWISTIVRHVAINFGLRHRRELDKRERWALENIEPATGEKPAHADEPLYTPETLRQTLAELPAAHRECLVLFYLEGRSGAEAANALGISESALRVRLHRARAVLRERLEARLADSLEQLRPAHSLVPAVMAGILASGPVKAAAAGGTGAALLGGLAKFTPLKWLFFFIPLCIPLISVLPGIFFYGWKARDDQKNFRDPTGFRARLHREAGRGWLIVLPVGMVLFFYLSAYTSSFFGTRTLFLAIGLFSLAGFAATVRQLEIDRRSSQFSLLLNSLVMTIVCFSVGLGLLPVMAIFGAVLFSSCLTRYSAKSIPLRMDSNLFLRAAQEMLPSLNIPGQRVTARQFSRMELRVFAQFLGERQLAVKFRWSRDGLLLFLAPVKSPLRRFWHNFYPSVHRDSYIFLGRNGSVQAHCGRNDVAGLAILKNNRLPALESLEQQVTAAVAQAWSEVRVGKTALAEQTIGQIPDAEIFVVPPGRTRANRWQKVIFGGMIAVCLLLFGWVRFFPESLSGLKPVNITEIQVRAFLNDTTPNPDPHKFQFNSMFVALLNCLVPPPRSLVTPEASQRMQRDAFNGAVADPSGSREAQMKFLYQENMAQAAIGGGWLNWNDFNFAPEDMGNFVRHQKEFNQTQKFSREALLCHEEAWSWVDKTKWEVERVNILSLNRLRWLRNINCLDLIDREKLIRQIVAVQVLSATPAPGQPSIHDWRDVRGLFFTPCWPALQDTYFALSALEILGGLDRIDREQCIRGILRVHHGKGFFESPDSGSFNEYHITGDARDTFAAFESLRILGALDRVKDLDHWQFRTRPIRDASLKDQLTWEEVEAWVCQQRLPQILRERKETPAQPAHSLLEPQPAPGI